MSDMARTDEATGSAAETLLIHFLPDAGTTIARLFRPRRGTGKKVALLTRRWNAETIAAVSTVAAKGVRARTGRHLWTLVAMITVRIAHRRPAARTISQTLAFAVPLRRRSPRIDGLSKHPLPLGLHLVLQSADPLGREPSRAFNPSYPSIMWSLRVTRSLKTISPTIRVTTTSIVTSVRTSRTVHAPGKRAVSCEAGNDLDRSTQSRFLNTDQIKDRHPGSSFPAAHSRSPGHSRSSIKRERGTALVSPLSTSLSVQMVCTLQNATQSPGHLSAVCLGAFFFSPATTLN